MHYLDFIVIGIFLILTLAIGLHAGRKIKTFQDYAVGNRQMSTTVLTLSLVASLYGGGSLNSHLGLAYHKPWFMVMVMLLMLPIDVYFFPRFLILRMKEFIGHLSIAESMGSIYGPTVRIFTGLFGIINSIVVLTLQIQVGLDITSILLPELGWFSTYATTLLTLLFVSYATFGGARAVAITDVYQFCLFTLCFPILFFVLLHKTKYVNDPVGSWKKLLEIPQFILNKKSIWHWDASQKRLQFYNCILLLISFLPPAAMQRFYMAPSIPQAKKIFNNAFIIRISLIVLLFGISIALHIGGHTIQPDQNILHYMLKRTYFPGMRGILITTILALLMSTADSQLHTASVLFANDIWPLVTGPANRPTPSLKIVRIASILISSISLLAALCNIQLISYEAGFSTLIIGIPFCITCFGFRPRAASVLLTMGIQTFLMIYYYRQSCGSPFTFFYYTKFGVCTLISNALILLAAHYLLPKRPHTGWIGIKDSSLWDLQNQTLQRWWRERLQQLTLPFTKTYLEYLFPKKRSTFILFGIYLNINTFIALCFIHQAYFIPYIYWYMAIMAIATTIATYPAFHSYQLRGNKVLHWVWPGLLFVLLFISNLQFVKLGHYRPMVCALFICNLGLGIIFLSLEISMIMLGIALLMHSYMPPYLPFYSLFLDWFTTLPIETVFAMIVITAAAVGLAIYKHLHDKADAKFQAIERTRTYEHKIGLETIYHQANWSRLDMTYGKQLLNEIDARLQSQGKLGNQIKLLMYKLHQFNNLLLRRVKAAPSLELNQNAVKTIAFEPVILKVYRTIRGLEAAMQLLLRIQTDVKQLLVDPALFECFLILNLWEISKCEQVADHVVTLTLADTTLRYDSTIATPSGKATLTLPALAFFISSDTSVQNALPVYPISDEPTPIYLPKTEKQFYQVESRQIVQAHGGYAEVIESKEILTCLYVLPITGHKVMHFKTYDPTDLATNKLAETAESLTQEKELVALLTTQTDLTKETVIQTIAFIKNAHGLVKRKSGAPYYTHPMEVTKLLLEVTKNPSTLLAGLLHDVIEDTPITLNQIKLMYGSEIASIVDSVTNYHTNGYLWKLDDAENKSILDQCRDIRVVEIKLADRLHNLRTLYARKLVSQKRIAKETMEFYIPWGQKNKISSKWLSEMEYICTSILNQ